MLSLVYSSVILDEGLVGLESCRTGILLDVGLGRGSFRD